MDILYANQLDRYLSIQEGLIYPDDMSLYSNLKTPAQYELDLASKKHRWPEMHKLHTKLFHEFMEKVTEHEEEILKVFDLPRIEVIRKADEKSYKGVELNKTRIDRLTTILKDWEDDLTGDGGVYNYHMLTGFSLGLSKNFEKILKQVPREMRDEYKKSRVFPAAGNIYYQKVITDGGKRLSALLSKLFKKEAVALMKYGIENNLPALEIGRLIHKTIGEGRAWHWLRLARSELVLAAERAYDAQADGMGIEFDQWSAATNACDLCATFDGNTWRRDEGPVPVYDTHPHCLCIRDPLFYYDGITQSRWTRETPYDQPYIEGELGLIQAALAA